MSGNFDVVIVGAGFAGLYMLYRSRSIGLSARVIEAGGGVGGTWYWNRYPGARCDVPSMEYSFSFSAELEQEWDWSETMASQEEIERYLNHVADRFQLRSDITLDTRVEAASFDNMKQQWTLTTNRGDRMTARFCIMATGCLSVPLTPEIAGLQSYEGVILHTSTWPRHEVDLSNKHVAVIGTGSSGVQTIPVIAARAASLTVFQRTPTYTWPTDTHPLDPAHRAEIRAHYPELRRRQRMSRTGTVGANEGPLDKPSGERLLNLDDKQRQDALDRHGFAVTNVFVDVAADPTANAAARDLYAQMVRRTVLNPETAAALTPRDHPLGCKRRVMNIGYFETFNRPNVALVDLQEEPIVSATKTGLQTSRRDFTCDAIVFATGFDAITGAMQRIDIRGKDGRKLKETWAHGPCNYLGLMVHGFPNLFMITGPGSPGSLTNVVVSIEQHVEWIAECISHMGGLSFGTIEPALEAEEQWVQHVNEVASGTMHTAAGCNSWYLGANVPGKIRQFMPYAAGVAAYRAKCDDVVAAGYEGFSFTPMAAAPSADVCRVAKN